MAIVLKHSRVLIIGRYGGVIYLVYPSVCGHVLKTGDLYLSDTCNEYGERV